MPKNYVTLYAHDSWPGSPEQFPCSYLSNDQFSKMLPEGKFRIYVMGYVFRGQFMESHRVDILYNLHMYAEQFLDVPGRPLSEEYIYHYHHKHTPLMGDAPNDAVLGYADSERLAIPLDTKYTYGDAALLVKYWRKGRMNHPNYFGNYQTVIQKGPSFMLTDQVAFQAVAHCMYGGLDGMCDNFVYQWSLDPLSGIEYVIRPTFDTFNARLQRSRKMMTTPWRKAAYWMDPIYAIFLDEMAGVWSPTGRQVVKFKYLFFDTKLKKNHLSAIRTAFLQTMHSATIHACMVLPKLEALTISCWEIVSYFK